MMVMVALLLLLTRTVVDVDVDDDADAVANHHCNEMMMLSAYRTTHSSHSHGDNNCERSAYYYYSSIQFL